MGGAHVEGEDLQRHQDVKAVTKKKESNEITRTGNLNVDEDENSVVVVVGTRRNEHILKSL